MLSYLAEGWTNRRMATALGISEKTVSVHIGNIKQKLGVEHRMEAAAVAIRLSLADDAITAEEPMVGRVGGEPTSGWSYAATLGRRS